jgi:hypothetical protein
VKSKRKYGKHNHPFHEVAENMRRKAQDGWNVYQKFTCAGCGARLTIDEPNKMYTQGTCDKCDAVTNIEEDGCNFLMTTRRLAKQTSH